MRRNKTLFLVALLTFGTMFLFAKDVTALSFGNGLSGGGSSSTSGTGDGGNTGASGSGSSGVTARPGCDSTDWHSSVCVGIGWKKYSVHEPVAGKILGNNSNPNEIFVPSDNFAQGGHIVGCAESGYYYRLGFVYYRNDEAGNIVDVSASVQRGLYNVNSGWPRYNGPDGGYEDWASVNAKFLIAQRMGVTSTDWNHTAYFCYNSDWETTPAPVTSTSYFESDSTVHVLPNNNDLSDHLVTSGRDGTAGVEVSTDADSVTLEFWHDVYYINGFTKVDYGDGHDKFADAKTTWGVTGDVGSSTGNEYKVGGGAPATTAAVDEAGNTSHAWKTTQTVSLGKGETKKVCSYINYAAKYMLFVRTNYTHWDTSTTPDTKLHDWKDVALNSTSGAGGSYACATITRPDDPPEITKGPWSTATANSTLMYAGETATIGWDASATSYATRRLRSSQATVYQTNVGVNYNSDITAGNLRYRGGDPCRYAGTKSGFSCKSLDGRTFDNGQGTSGTESDSEPYDSKVIVVPDNVGDKYCNGFGYRYEYWYAHEIDGNVSWTHDSPRDYWNMYPSACRTIAKKPSMALWNGSILTNGGVITSLSPRYTDPVMGNTVGDQNTPRIQYGSWAEYLDVIYRNVNGFTSGATLSIGSGNDDTWVNSPLTISNNTNLLGHSGITSNSSFLTRLNTFIGSRANTIGGNNNTINGAWVTSSENFYKYNGTLNITGNIISANNNSYSSIYALPQTIIFVNGDVKISGNVTQIDAWIIATGSIDTCSEFSDGSTEADALGHPRAACTNQLVFNGPIVANKLLLHRSFGSDPLIDYNRVSPYVADTERNRWAAAEVFNLRADTYLWAYAQAGRYDSSYTESYSRELAPRY